MNRAQRRAIARRADDTAAVMAAACYDFEGGGLVRIRAAAPVEETQSESAPGANPFRMPSTGAFAGQGCMAARLSDAPRFRDRAGRRFAMRSRAAPAAA